VEHPTRNAGKCTVLHSGLPFAVSPGGDGARPSDAVGVIRRQINKSTELGCDVAAENKLHFRTLVQVLELLAQLGALRCHMILKRSLCTFIAVREFLVVDMSSLAAAENGYEEGEKCGKPQSKNGLTHDTRSLSMSREQDVCDDNGDKVQQLLPLYRPL